MKLLVLFLCLINLNLYAQSSVKSTTDESSFSYSPKGHKDNKFYLPLIDYFAASINDMNLQYAINKNLLIGTHYIQDINSASRFKAKGISLELHKETDMNEESPFIKFLVFHAEIGDKYSRDYIYDRKVVLGESFLATRVGLGYKWYGKHSFISTTLNLDFLDKTTLQGISPAFATGISF